MKNRILLFAALFILLCYTSGLAQQGNIIRGKVRNSSGANLPRIIVELQTGNGSQINQTVTSNEGDFIFSDLTGTSYIIVISTPDYNPINERVEFISVVSNNVPGETRTVEFTLTPRSAERIPPPASTFTQPVPKTARDAFDRALRLAREGRSQDAVAGMQEAIKLYPEYFDAHFALGNEFTKMERLDEAISELEQARRINPKDGRVYQSFGLVLTKQKKFPLAAAVFGEAFRLSPTDPQILVMRATTLIEHASMIDPSSSNKAAAERDQALALAEKDLTRASELSGKKLASVHIQMARLHEKRGDRARAASELERYLQMNPEAKNAAAIREAIKSLRSAAGGQKPAPPQQ